MFKYTLILLLFCCCFSVRSYAQWSVGISAGPNLSIREWRAWNQDQEFNIGYTPGLAFSSAAIGQYSVNSVLALRVEAGYSDWASRLEVEITDGNGANFAVGTVTDHLQALTGGFFAQITPFRQKKFYFLAGPSGAYIVKNRTRLNKGLATETGLPRTQTHDLEDRYISPGQFLINLGAGTSWALGQHGQLSLELRHQLGLTDLSSASTVDARISSIMLNVGYLHRL